jgi:hypothetical protein
VSSASVAGIAPDPALPQLPLRHRADRAGARPHAREGESRTRVIRQHEPGRSVSSSTRCLRTTRCTTSCWLTPRSTGCARSRDGVPRAVREVDDACPRDSGIRRRRRPPRAWPPLDLAPRPSRSPASGASISTAGVDVGADSPRLIHHAGPSRALRLGDYFVKIYASGRLFEVRAITFGPPSSRRCVRQGAKRRSPSCGSRCSRSFRENHQQLDDAAREAGACRAPETHD